MLENIFTYKTMKTRLLELCIISATHMDGTTQKFSEGSIQSDQHQAQANILMYCWKVLRLKFQQNRFCRISNHKNAYLNIGTPSYIYIYNISIHISRYKQSYDYVTDSLTNTKPPCLQSAGRHLPLRSSMDMSGYVSQLGICRNPLIIVQINVDV